MNIWKSIIAKFRKKNHGFDQPRPFQSGWGGNWGGMIEMPQFYDDSDKRKTAKPVDVFKQIIGKEPKMNLKNLDTEIGIVEKRAEFLKENFPDIGVSDEEVALKFLLARKKYDAAKDRFRWPITSQEKIDKLCSKYRLRIVSFTSFYKTVPDEGLDEMEDFMKAYQKVRKDEPFFQLIADETGEETKKADPILLAGSPFGNWFYVLGAWDKEVEIVDQLVYPKRGPRRVMSTGMQATTTRPVDVDIKPKKKVTKRKKK